MTSVTAPSSAAVKKPTADDTTRSTVLRVALRTLTLLPLMANACASMSAIAALTLEMRVPGGLELDSLRDGPRQRVRDRHVRRVPQWTDVTAASRMMTNGPSQRVRCHVLREQQKAHHRVLCDGDRRCGDVAQR